MKKEEIQLWDFKRILLGEAPLDFMLEVFIRTVVIFLILSIAAAIGVPLQDPSKGLLPALIIAIVIVGFIRIINNWLMHSKTLEKRMQGNFSVLIQDGIINIKI